MKQAVFTSALVCGLMIPIACAGPRAQIGTSVAFPAVQTSSPHLDANDVKQLAALGSFVDIQTNLPDDGTACDVGASKATIYVRCVVSEPQTDVRASRSIVQMQGGDYLALGMSLHQHPPYILFANPLGVTSQLPARDAKHGLRWSAFVEPSPDSWAVTYAIDRRSLPPDAGANDDSLTLGMLRFEPHLGRAWYWPRLTDKHPFAAQNRISVRIPA
ncbi:MAG: hypothetical protein KGN02_13900 [bacterium]|nr:hypothetical protein [bacterium]